MLADLLCFACRLKAAQGSKTITSLLALKCQRRILLTGTPVQNNLDEFFGKLGVLKAYKLLLACVHARSWADCHIQTCLDMSLQNLAYLPASLCALTVKSCMLRTRNHQLTLIDK